MNDSHFNLADNPEGPNMAKEVAKDVGKVIEFKDEDDSFMTVLCNP